MRKHSAPENFKSWLQDELEDRGWSYNRLAREAGQGASHTLTVLILKGERSLSWDYCAAIARAFNLSPIRVFLEAGLLTIDDLPFPARLNNISKSDNNKVPEF